MVKEKVKKLTKTQQDPKHWHMEEKLGLTAEDFAKCKIYIHEHKPSVLPSKDHIKDTRGLMKPERKNLQVCFANVVYPEIIGYAVGYANVLRSCERMVSPWFQQLVKARRNPSYKPTLDLFKLDRQKCFWALDHEDECNHKPYALVDSGLFKIMYKDKVCKEDAEIWNECYHSYIDHMFEPGVSIHSNNKPYFVDLDWAPLFGVEYAKKCRDELQRRHPNDRFIFTWHFEDGIKGLDEMIEKYDYIAMGTNSNLGSMAQMGKLKAQMAMYARKRSIELGNPNLKIHMLGTDNIDVIARTADIATTCDSTRHECPLRFGQKATLSFLRTRLGWNEKRVNTYIDWVVKESGFLELIRAYMPHLFNQYRSEVWTPEDGGWTFKNCECGAWLMLEAYDNFCCYEHYAGPQARWGVNGTRNGIMAPFANGIHKIYHGEKVTNADVEGWKAPYETYEKIYTDEEGKPFRLTGEPDYFHLDPNRCVRG